MHRKELKIKILSLILAVFLMLLFGTLLFSLLEDWSLLDSFYFVTMTATTVGYGDFAPTHGVSKIITVFYSLSIVPLVLYSFSMVARYQTDKIYQKIHRIEMQQQEQIEENEEDLEKAEKVIKKQKKEISEHDKELEVVEKVLAAKVNKKK